MPKDSLFKKQNTSRPKVDEVSIIKANAATIYDLLGHGKWDVGASVLSAIKQ